VGQLRKRAAHEDERRHERVVELLELGAGDHRWLQRRGHR
jgi:hypothetical protein